MTECGINWQVVAAIASALAAVASCAVTYRIFRFHKNATLKGRLVEALSAASYQMHRVRSFADKSAFDLSDEDFGSWQGEAAAAIEQALRLITPKVQRSRRNDVGELGAFAVMLREEKFDPYSGDSGESNAHALAETERAIDAIQRIYEAEIKS